MVSHSPPMIKAMCDMAMVLEHGDVTFYEDVDAALEHHDENMKRGRPQ